MTRGTIKHERARISAPKFARNKLRKQQLKHGVPEKKEAAAPPALEAAAKVKTGRLRKQRKQKPEKKLSRGIAAAAAAAMAVDEEDAPEPSIVAAGPKPSQKKLVRAPKTAVPHTSVRSRSRANRSVGKTGSQRSAIIRKMLEKKG
eukprot:Hpha_TRINITY_DN15583_c0_g2::TRINITY_DN15583_c0_g2_i1::g.103970::m.103970